MADYYNRQLSGWEPFVERWPARVHWFTEPANQMHPSRQIVKVTAKERLYVNITASLIAVFQTTKRAWFPGPEDQDGRSPQPG
ncbi:intermembrane lipid transfer protein VPS13D-like [Lampetra planeri]